MQWREAVKQKGEGQARGSALRSLAARRTSAWRVASSLCPATAAAKDLLPARRHARARAGAAPRVGQVRRQSHAARLLAAEPALSTALGACSAKNAAIPSSEHAPLFLYGHSNGTGFSAIFPLVCAGARRGWVSMRPGHHLPSSSARRRASPRPRHLRRGRSASSLAPPRDENLDVVPALRKNHRRPLEHRRRAKDRPWPRREDLAARVSAFCVTPSPPASPPMPMPRTGPAKLRPLTLESGHLGQNWQPKPGGYQKLLTAPFAAFPGDKSTASWLLNADYAKDWQQFQSTGAVQPKK